MEPNQQINEVNSHERSIETLIDIYGKQIDTDKIRQIYRQVQSKYKDATVKQYLPILIRRDAGEILSQEIEMNSFAILPSHCQ
jgi:hypothetical protein